MWRLVMAENVSISYAEACEMDVHELMEANAALDLYIEQQKKANKKGGKK